MNEILEVPLSRKKLIVVAMGRDRAVLHYAHRPYTSTRLWVYFNDRDIWAAFGGWPEALVMGDLRGDRSRWIAVYQQYMEALQLELEYNRYTGSLRLLLPADGGRLHRPLQGSVLEETGREAVPPNNKQTDFPFASSLAPS